MSEVVTWEGLRARFISTVESLQRARATSGRVRYSDADRYPVGAEGRLSVVAHHGPERVLHHFLGDGLRDLVRFSTSRGEPDCIALEGAGTTAVRRHRSMLRPGGAASTKHPERETDHAASTEGKFYLQDGKLRYRSSRTIGTASLSTARGNSVLTMVPEEFVYRTGRAEYERVE
jgi:hypothetical protein